MKRDECLFRWGNGKGKCTTDDFAQRKCTFTVTNAKKDTDIPHFFASEAISKVLPNALKCSLESHSGAFSVVIAEGSHTQTAGNDLPKDQFQIISSQTFEIASDGPDFFEFCYAILGAFSRLIGH